MKIHNWTRKFFEEVPGEGAGEGAAAPAADSWLSGLSPELQDNASLKDIADVEGLAKRFIDTKAMVGNSIRVPSEDAAPEDMAAFKQSLIDKNLGLVSIPDTDDKEAMAGIHRALGLPEDATGYSKPENWTGMTDERFGFLAGEAHKAGLSKSQFDQMANTMAAADNETSQGYQTEHQAGIDTLKGEWGNAYTQRISRAANVAKQLEAPAPLQEALAAGEVDAGTLRWLDTISQKFSGEGSSLVTDEGGVTENTPSELRERVAELTTKMFSMSVSDPMYQPTLQKRLKYLEMLNPEKK